MNKELKELFDNAMIKLVLDFPIYANLLSYIPIEINNDMEALGSTNGKTIRLNEKLLLDFMHGKIYRDEDKKQSIGKMNKDHLIYLLCHELLHIIGFTFTRGKHLGVKDNLDHEIWNIASDFEINNILVKNKIGEYIKDTLYDPKYDNYTAEQIYNEIIQYKDQLPTYEIPIGIGFDKDGNKKEITFDKYEGTELSDEESNSLVGKIAKVLEDYQNQKDYSVSPLDNSIFRLLEELVKPKPFNWKSALSKYVKSYIKCNYSWNKPNRSGIANNIRLPSTSTTPCIHIAVALDTSGSMSNKEISTMLGYILTVCKQFKNYKLDVWCCGTVALPESFKTFTPKNAHTIKNYPIQSDGGTNLRTNYDFINEKYKSNKPDIFICLTDGADSLSGDTEYKTKISTVFLIVNNKHFIKPTKIPCEVYYVEN